MSMRPNAIVIGSGFGGLSLAIRLQGLGYNVTVLEKLDKAGGRAYLREVDGFKFDMGPTVITVPHFIEELFSITRDRNHLDAADYPDDILSPARRIRSGISGGPETSKYCDILPVFYLSIGFTSTTALTLITTVTRKTPDGRSLRSNPMT